MYCPKCRQRFKRERICPTCHRVLVEERPDADGIEAPGEQPPTNPATGPDHYGFERDDGQSVTESVFQTKDTGLLPLATMALDAAGIHYVVHGGGSDMFGLASGIELHVRPADATDARRLLADLEQAGERGMDAFDPRAPASDVPESAGETRASSGSGGTGSINLVDAESGWQVSAVTEDQLEWLGQRLERDLGKYYIDPATLDMLEGEGADAGLLDALRKALGDREGVDVRPSSELLFDAETGRRVGVLSEEQVAWLLQHGAPAELELTDALLVRLEDEGVEAGLLDMLHQAVGAGVTHVTAVKPDPRRPPGASVPLIDTQADGPVGAITESQAAWLADRLDVEPAVFGKPDYCIDGDVLRGLEEDGADPVLLDTLREALGDRDEMFVRW